MKNANGIIYLYIKITYKLYQVTWFNKYNRFHTHTKQNKTKKENKKKERTKGSNIILFEY